jgi:hypothetical protein
LKPIILNIDTDSRVRSRIERAQKDFWPVAAGSRWIDHLEAAMANIDANKAKSTVFIGGLAQTVDEAVLVQAFSPFGPFLFSPLSKI